MRLGFITILTVLFIGNSFAYNRSSNNVMVTINNIRVTEQQVDSLLSQQLKMAMAFGNRPDEVMVHNLRIRIIDEIIERVLIEEEAEVKGIKITQKEVDKKIEEIAFDEGMTVEDFVFKALPANNTNLAEFRDRVVVGMKFDRLLQLDAGKKAFVVTDEQAKQYYARNMKRFDMPKRVRASHIMIEYPGMEVKDKADVFEAMGVLRKMAVSGTEFAELAKKYSEDRVTAKEGGDLGFFIKESMPPAIAEPAFSMKPGQISDIIQMPYGCHLFKVTEIDSGGIEPFEKVKMQIKRWIQDERKRMRSESYMRNLIDKARIRWPGGKKPQLIKPEVKPEN